MEEPAVIAASAGRAVRAEMERPGSLALLFMATALTLVTIFVLPEWQVPAAWPATIVVISLAALWIILAALRRALGRTATLSAKVGTLEQESSAQLPRVLRAMLNPGDEEELILLLRPNRLFGQFMIVSFYYEDERGFELYVGTGEVSNVQSDGAIQITVRVWEEPYQDIRRSLIEQKPDTLARLLVRPAPAALPGSPTFAAIQLLSQNETLRRPANG